MAKIRHIAIKVEDQEKTAEFYKKTFGMTEAWRGPVREDGNRGEDDESAADVRAVRPQEAACRGRCSAAVGTLRHVGSGSARAVRGLSGQSADDPI